MSEMSNSIITGSNCKEVQLKQKVASDREKQCAFLREVPSYVRVVNGTYPSSLMRTSPAGLRTLARRAGGGWSMKSAKTQNKNRARQSSDAKERLIGPTWLRFALYEEVTIASA